MQGKQRNTYKFQYFVHQRLPKLGWGMCVHGDSEIVDVHVGTQVETNDSFFVAGVWDGNFLDGMFDQADFLCGSGAKICKSGEIKICTASHERERVVFIKRDQECWFANSIPLLLALAGERVDIENDQYEKQLCSILNGLEEYSKTLPLANGSKFHQIFCADIMIDMKGKIHVKEREKHSEFKNFDDYYISLLTVCKEIKKNASHEQRKHKYNFVTTVSSGYDSSACAAIAREMGCDIACTFTGGGYEEDSGVDVARQLGYSNIIERDCNLYKTREARIDALSVCNGDLGGYQQMVAFEDIFAGNIVFMGLCGDTAYGLDVRPNSKLKRFGVPFFQANLSFAEMALEVGFIVLPMPLYALTAHQSIHHISCSEEMKKWRLNNSYDRPIPRRIVEMHGVNREAFGMEKHGAGFSFSKNFSKTQIKRKMTEEGYAEFIHWLSEPGHNRWNVKRIKHMFIYHFASIPEYKQWALSKMHIKVKHGHGEKVNPYPNPGVASKLLVWGIVKLTDEYQKAIL